ncbi:MAG: ABC transporter permease subunit [Micromonosporaceae bacterium]|nr:ABC transporter permease subunit [Micromonosporaceae bacterium]
MSEVTGSYAAPAGAGATAGVIHDIGYQRYTGRRLSRRYSALSMYTHSVRTAYGLGRSGKAKIFPFIVVGIVFAVAVIAVVLRSQFGRVFINYLQLADGVTAPLLLFVAVIAPELVSRDLRAHTLPLYFSRPISRSDYAFAKYAAAATAMWLLLACPMLLMYIGGLFSQNGGFAGAWRETTEFLQGLGYAAIFGLIYAAISVLIASLASRRAVAAGAIVGVFLVTAPVVGVLTSFGGDTLQKVAPLLNPVTLVQGLQVWLFGGNGPDIGSFGPLYGAVGVALIGVCLMLLLARYRRVS